MQYTTQRMGITMLTPPRLEEMDLRDLMAMFAMQGLLAHGGWKSTAYIPDSGIAGTAVANEAYSYADAMLAVHNKPDVY